MIVHPPPGRSSLPMFRSVSSRALVVLAGVTALGCESPDSADGAASGISDLPAGVGAIPHDGGVLFRVWAPGASRVFVAGQFSDWKLREMAAEADDYFAV